MAAALTSGGCGRKAASPATSEHSVDAATLVVGDGASPDAIPDEGTTPPGGGAAAIDGGAVRIGSLPAGMREFDAFLRDLERRPSSAVRTKRTCSIAANDARRIMFFAAWKVSRPARVPVEEWEQASEDFVNTMDDIGNMCQDIDWRDDEQVLIDLRARLDRLAGLASQ